VVPAIGWGQGSQLTGQLDLIWGDSRPGFGNEAHLIITLTEGSGETTELSLSDEMLRQHGGFLDWNGRQVRVDLRPVEEGTAPRSPRGARRVAALTLLDTAGSFSTRGGAVSGSQPWVSILCKFSDQVDEPEDLTFFQEMYENAPGRLDHYWREQSYGIIDVAGSVAIDWVDLPGTQGSYIPTPGSGSDSNLSALFNDCTAAADPFVDFSNGGTAFVGINQMFNDVLDCCAWGGSRFATLDGVTKSWRVTWEPPWGYADEGVIGHEMGHGFGLPHSNNWDGDGSPYDSPWDVMSAAVSYSPVDATYGRLGKHTIAYHKDRLSWFSPSERIEVPIGGTVNVVVDPLALATTTNYRMIKIPIDGSASFYTVEVRDLLGNYDGALPGNAVIVHFVDPFRAQPAWAVDTDVPPANFGDNEGTMFRVGETYFDAANLVTVTVQAATAEGFLITASSGDVSQIFADGFESGDALNWSSTSP
jgi:hypothetical protein